MDTNRCILCGRCIRASRDVDGKHIFEYVGRGIHKSIGVDGPDLAHTVADKGDVAFALETCPVGCIIQKRKGYFAPVGKRQFDKEPIGSEIEQSRER